jgi:hypothetical protein
MLWKTFETFRDLVDYSRNGDGTWHAEFHGAIDVAVQAASLYECQREIQEALDQKLAEWIRVPRTTPTRRRRFNKPQSLKPKA